MKVWHLIVAWLLAGLLSLGISIGVVMFVGKFFIDAIKAPAPTPEHVSK